MDPVPRYQQPPFPSHFFAQVNIFSFLFYLFFFSSSQVDQTRLWPSAFVCHWMCLARSSPALVLYLRTWIGSIWWILSVDPNLTYTYLAFYCALEEGSNLYCWSHICEQMPIHDGASASWGVWGVTSCWCCRASFSGVTHSATMRSQSSWIPRARPQSGTCLLLGDISIDSGTFA